MTVARHLVLEATVNSKPFSNKFELKEQEPIAGFIEMWLRELRDLVGEPDEGSFSFHMERS